MINRALLTVHLKQPFVDWINAADPTSMKGGEITLLEANDDRPAFLIHEDAAEYVEEWLEQNFIPLFEDVLEQWYIDDSLWPQDRTLDLFQKWCSVEIHSMVFDTVDEPIVDDDY